MPIPLQPVNLAPYKSNPGLTIAQLANSLAQLPAIAAHTQLTKAQIPATDARTELTKAQTAQIPIQAQAALYSAHNPAIYGAAVNPMTGAITPYNKYTGQVGLPGIQGNVGGVQPQLMQQPMQQPMQAGQPQQAIGGAPVQSVQQGSPIAGSIQPSVQSVHAPSQQALSTPMQGTVPAGSTSYFPAAHQLPDTQNVIRNLMTGSLYRRGGTQSLFREPKGNVISISSPTTSASTSQQLGQMGEAAFSATYPYLAQSIKNFGSSTYGAGLHSMVKSFLAKPSEKNAQQLALFFAVQQIKPSIAGDLARMTTGGTPAERTMAEYGSTAFKQLPSDRWARAALLGNPKLAQKVQGYQSHYYKQLEQEIQNSRGRSLALQTPVNLGSSVGFTGLGQPIPEGADQIPGLD